MGWIGPLWIGLVVGAAARVLHPTGMRLGLLAAMLAGIVGALLAYYGGQPARPDRHEKSPAVRGFCFALA